MHAFPCVKEIIQLSRLALNTTTISHNVEGGGRNVDVHLVQVLRISIYAVRFLFFPPLRSPSILAWLQAIDDPHADMASAVFLSILSTSFFYIFLFHTLNLFPPTVSL